MSIYSIINGSEPAFFSSLQGWKDVTTWTESLDHSVFEEIVHLTEHGFSNDIKALVVELRKAIKKSTPSESVQSTISELIDLLSGESGEVIINSGMTV